MPSPFTKNYLSQKAGGDRMAFSDEFLELLRNTCTMESIASDYVSLKRSGRNYVCNCPFHSEKSPSCTIFPDTQSFYCFGCGVGGDVIMWIRHIETMEFPEAVRFLAEKAGLEIPTDREAQQQVAYRKQLMAANREAANFYYLNLVKGTDKRGLQYFISRGLKPETIRKYGLGFASDNWTSLTQHLLQKGFTEQELLDADLARRSTRTDNGKLYDTFRNRVIFPIVNLKGNIIAFGGRVLDDSKPKYLNTSDTRYFDKSQNLFSLNFAKDSDSTQIILAEGYMDVIAINQAGFSNVVASLGTSITDGQAHLLQRHAREIIIAYDNDAAGQIATRRAVRRFEAVGLPTKILRLHNVKDPDEYIRKFGTDRFRLLLEQSGEAIEFLVNQCENGIDFDSPTDKAKYLDKVVSVLSDYQNTMLQEIYAGKAAEKCGIRTETIMEQIRKNIRKNQRIEKKKETAAMIEHTVRPDPKNPRMDLRENRSEEMLLCYLLAHPEDINWVSSEITPTHFTSELYQKVYNAFLENGKYTSLSTLGNGLTTEEMGKITGIQAKRSEMPPITRNEAKDCIQALLQPKKKAVETDADLLARVQAKQKHTNI